MEAATQPTEQQRRTEGNVGTVEEVQGVVVEVAFADGQLPEIYNALLVETTVSGEIRTMTMEVALHIGDNMVRAIALKPDFMPALMNGGKLYISQKKPDQAVETLTRAVAAEPESADANQYLGEAYLLARKGSSAVTYLEKAIELQPVEKAEVHLRLAALYNAANLKERAIAEYKKFLEKVPDHPEKVKIEKYISDNSTKN